MQNLNKAIFKIVDYEFKNNALLEEALTHPSINKKNSKNKPLSYERLEFLGDSVLNMIVSAMIFDLFPDEEEGSLAKRKMYLVCGSAIANIAKEIGLANFIIINNSERCNGGLSNLKNLENSLEALIGAMYIDGGLLIVKRFVIKHWEKLAKTALDPPQDPKTSLQEWAQKNKISLPEYTLVKKDGPAHKPEFTISVCVENYEKVTASSYSKKVAEQKAAESILKKINNNNEE